MTSVKVAIRVRPFNEREITNGSGCCIKIEGDTTIITDPQTGTKKKFTFDHSYWSHDGYEVDESTGMFEKNSPSSIYASQTMVFNDLGLEVLDNAFNGYHTCLFAYGQTGSGKSYSIFGYGANIGIIPMACSEIFRRITEAKEKAENDNKSKNENVKEDDNTFVAGNIKYEVTVSMLEIYNE